MNATLLFEVPLRAAEHVRPGTICELCGEDGRPALRRTVVAVKRVGWGRRRRLRVELAECGSAPIDKRCTSEHDDQKPAASSSREA
jgi:hypothetical protein